MNDLFEIFEFGENENMMEVELYGDGVKFSIIPPDSEDVLACEFSSKKDVLELVGFLNELIKQI